MSNSNVECDGKTKDGRACQKLAGHKGRCLFNGIDGQQCTCMLRWYPNRCTAHPEMNQ